MFRPPSHWKDLKDLVDSRIPNNLMNLPTAVLNGFWANTGCPASETNA